MSDKANKCPRGFCDGSGWLRLGRKYSRCDCAPDPAQLPAPDGSYRNRAMFSYADKGNETDGPKS